MQGSHHNLPAQVPGQWHKPNWRWIHLPRGQHPATHGGRARPEGITPWQMLFYPNSQPPQDHSPKTRKRGQHDHGGKESPVSGNVRHVWSRVRELNPKKTKPCGCTHTSTQQAERSLCVSGHLIPGDHPR